jgi:glycosyltransferase involved in cell wall biosynthesis
MREKIRVHFISTWNVKCGIAEYSKFLVDAINQIGIVKVNVVAIVKATKRNPRDFLHYLQLVLNTGRNCDVVHIQYQPSFFIFSRIRLDYFPMMIWILQKTGKTKIVVTVHELGNSRGLAARRDMRFLRMVDLLIVHSSEHRQVLIQSGLKEERIVQIPHGTMDGQILDKTECKEKLGLTGKKVLVVFGFINPFKGYDLAIQALPYLPKDTVLLVSGSAFIQRQSEYLKQLKTMAAALCVEERVKFLDYVPNEGIPLIMNASDIAIFPYRDIEVSGALNMALGHKVATITSDLPYFKEIKQTYDCIEIFRRGDYQELAQVIISLLSDNDRINYLSKRCDGFIESTNWDTVASRTVDSYLQVMTGHSYSV